MLQTHLKNFLRPSNHMAGDDRYSNLSGADSRQTHAVILKPEEEYDFSLVAIFDSYGFVCDLKDNSLNQLRFNFE